MNSEKWFCSRLVIVGLDPTIQEISDNTIERVCFNWEKIKIK